MTKDEVLIATGASLIAGIGFVVSTSIRFINYKKLKVKSSFWMYWLGSYRFYNSKDKTPDVKAAEYLDLFLTSGVMFVCFIIFTYFFIIP